MEGEYLFEPCDTVICTATKIQDMKMKINPGDTMRLLFVKIHRIKQMRLCKLHGIKSVWRKRIAEEKTAMRIDKYRFWCYDTIS